MIRSPISTNPELKKLAFHTRMMADLLKVHGALIEQVEEHKSKADSVLEQAEEVRQALLEARDAMRAVQNLPKGDDGYTPVKGEDYFTDEEIYGIAQLAAKHVPTPKDGKTPEKGKDYFTPRELESIKSDILGRIKEPRDGQDAVIDEDALAEAIIEKIKDGKKFKIEHVDGLRAEVDSYRNQMARRQAGQHGGGTTVSAGTNVTLVPLADGTVQINASGGTSGTNVTTQYALTAVQAGSDVTIDLTQLPNTITDVIALYRNNQMQTEGASYNFTVSGDIVTVFNADAGEIFNITYAYA